MTGETQSMHLYGRQVRPTAQVTFWQAVEKEAKILCNEDMNERECAEAGGHLLKIAKQATSGYFFEENDDIESRRALIAAEGLNQGNHSRSGEMFNKAEALLELLAQPELFVPEEPNTAHETVKPCRAQAACKCDTASESKEPDGLEVPDTAEESAFAVVDAAKKPPVHEVSEKPAAFERDSEMGAIVGQTAPSKSKPKREISLASEAPRMGLDEVGPKTDAGLEEALDAANRAAREAKRRRISQLVSHLRADAAEAQVETSLAPEVGTSPRSEGSTDVITEDVAAVGKDDASAVIESTAQDAVAAREDVAVEAEVDEQSTSAPIAVASSGSNGFVDDPVASSEEVVTDEEDEKSVARDGAESEDDLYDLLIDDANSLRESGRYEAAAALYGQIVLGSPRPEHRAEARYGELCSYLGRGDLFRAKKAADDLSQSTEYLEPFQAACSLWFAASTKGKV